MFRRIMVYLDDSKLAEQVMPYAEAEALSFNSRVAFFEAIPELLMVSPGMPSTESAPVVTESLIKQTEKAHAALFVSPDDVLEAIPDTVKLKIAFDDVED